MVTGSNALIVCRKPAITMIVAKGKGAEELRCTAQRRRRAAASVDQCRVSRASRDATLSLRTPRRRLTAVAARPSAISRSEAATRNGSRPGAVVQSPGTGSTSDAAMITMERMIRNA